MLGLFQAAQRPHAQHRPDVNPAAACGICRLEGLGHGGRENPATKLAGQRRELTLWITTGATEVESDRRSVAEGVHTRVNHTRRGWAAYEARPLATLHWEFYSNITLSKQMLPPLLTFVGVGGVWRNWRDGGGERWAQERKNQEETHLQHKFLWYALEIFRKYY